MLRPNRMIDMELNLQDTVNEEAAAKAASNIDQGG
jgi:hypothetical protein